DLWAGDDGEPIRDLVEPRSNEEDLEEVRVGVREMIREQDGGAAAQPLETAGVDERGSRSDGQRGNRMRDEPSYGVRWEIGEGRTRRGKPLREPFDGFGGLQREQPPELGAQIGELLGRPLPGEDEDPL